MPDKKIKKSKPKHLSLDSSDEPSSVDDEVSRTSVDSSKLEKRKDEFSPKSKKAKRAKCKSDYSPSVSREDIWQKVRTYRVFYYFISILN